MHTSCRTYHIHWSGANSQRKGTLHHNTSKDTKPGRNRELYNSLVVSTVKTKTQSCRGVGVGRRRSTHTTMKVAQEKDEPTHAATCPSLAFPPAALLYSNPPTWPCMASILPSLAPRTRQTKTTHFRIELKRGERKAHTTSHITSRLEQHGRIADG